MATYGRHLANTIQLSDLCDTVCYRRRRLSRVRRAYQMVPGTVPTQQPEVDIDSVADHVTRLSPYLLYDTPDVTSSGSPCDVTGFPGNPPRTKSRDLLTLEVPTLRLVRGGGDGDVGGPSPMIDRCCGHVTAVLPLRPPARNCVTWSDSTNHVVDHRDIRRANDSSDFTHR